MKLKKPLKAFTDEDFVNFRLRFVIQTLRRASYRWPWRDMATKRARVGWGIFKCELCGGLVSPQEKKLDHIVPVIDPLVGFDGFGRYVERLFVREDSFQVICTWCHLEKTGKENEQRKQARAKRDEHKSNRRIKRQ